MEKTKMLFGLFAQNRQYENVTNKSGHADFDKQSLELDWSDVCKDVCKTLQHQVLSTWQQTPDQIIQHDRCKITQHIKHRIE